MWDKFGAVEASKESDFCLHKMVAQYFLVTFDVSVVINMFITQQHEQ